MVDIQKIKINANAINVLESALGDDKQLIIDEINRGRCELFQYSNGYFVTRSEQSELVIVALAGSHLRSVANQIAQVAKRAGFQSIRYHTKRPALKKLLNSFDVQEVERVYKIGL